MSLTGNFIDAERAEAWGLVNRVCAADSLLDEALASAAQIADADPKAVFALKALMNDGVKETLGNALVLEGERGNAFAKTVDYSQMSDRLAALRQRASKQ
jgi:enoyl-CoA hydratase